MFWPFAARWPSPVVSSSAVLFFLTRMEGVPRSTPLIYGLVLGSGMIVARTVVRALHKETPRQGESIGLDSTARNLRRVLLIGVDQVFGDDDQADGSAAPPHGSGGRRAGPARGAAWAKHQRR